MLPEIENTDASNESSSKNSILIKKFFISFTWTLTMLFMSVYLTMSSENWGAGLVGAALGGLVSGVVSMLLPTKLKIIYVPVSIIVAFLVLLLI